MSPRLSADETAAQALQDLRRLLHEAFYTELERHIVKLDEKINTIGLALNEIRDSLHNPKPKDDTAGDYGEELKAEMKELFDDFLLDLNLSLNQIAPSKVFPATEPPTPAMDLQKDTGAVTTEQDPSASQLPGTQVTVLVQTQDGPSHTHLPQGQATELTIGQNSGAPPQLPESQISALTSQIGVRLATMQRYVFISTMVALLGWIFSAVILWRTGH